MQFKDIIGQKDVVGKLVGLVDEGRMPHAMMLAGGEGVGKLAIAIALAQYMCCENRHGGDSCGECASCVKYAKLSHPDFHLVFPIVQEKARKIELCDDCVKEFREAVMDMPYMSFNDWASVHHERMQPVIYASEADEIVRKLSLKPYESVVQVMVVWCPERMNEKCANSLLKFVEEPSANTHLIFVSDRVHDVMGTIQSRTQVVNVPPIDVEDVMERARRVYGDDVGEEELANVAKLARGSWNRFEKEMAMSEDRRENMEQFVAMMRLSWTLDVRGVMQWSKEVAGIGREAQVGMLQFAQGQLRENFIKRLGCEELSYMNGVEREFAEKFHRFIHENNIEDMMNELQLAEEQIAQNASARIVFFHLPFVLYKLIKRGNDN